MRKAWILPVLLAAIAVSGCTATNNSDSASAASARCQQKCMDLADTNMDFSPGPCLDDAIASDWVCDMAHNPRQAVDDNPANQCPSFGNAAHHFVEVNENCRILRVV